MSDSLGWIAEALNSLETEGLRRQRRKATPVGDGQYQIDGQTAWDFASNDYLGLASDPKVIAAAEAALRSHGVGSKASALVCGRTDLHDQLEQTIADFEGTESAIVFPTGMATNLGTIPALIGPDDVIFSDRLNHASLIDGSRLSGARIRVYRHTDLDGLKSALARESARRKFIITDSIFSMDGDLAPLPDLCDIAESQQAAVMIDEAHGTGVFGHRGRGVAELLGVEERIAVRVGTLSKAIGAIGGFIAGRRDFTDYLWNKARTQVYSTSLPPVICAAATAAIEIIRDEPHRREKLHALCTMFRERLRAKGIEVYPGSVGPIVPIVLHEPEAAVRVADQLLQDGYLVGAIRPPTVPKGTSRLRVCLHLGIPDQVAESLADAIGNAVATVV